MTRRNRFFASSIPAAVQHVAACQPSTLRLIRRTVLFIDRVRRSERALQPTTHAQGVAVSASSMPSLSDAAAPGWLQASSSERVLGAVAALADGRLAPAVRA
jgi:hypothetical protein